MTIHVGYCFSWIIFHTYVNWLVSMQVGTSLVTYISRLCHVCGMKLKTSGSTCKKAPNLLIAHDFTSWNFLELLFWIPTKGQNLNQGSTRKQPIRDLSEGKADLPINLSISRWCEDLSIFFFFYPVIIHSTSLSWSRNTGIGIFTTTIRNSSKLQNFAWWIVSFLSSWTRSFSTHIFSSWWAGRSWWQSNPIL